MARIIALVLAFAFAFTCAARDDVALVGLIGDKAAVLAVDGEVVPGVRSVIFSVTPGALTYYSPAS